MDVSSGMVAMRSSFVVAIVLVGCSADLEEAEASTPEEEALAFELPEACAGWRHLAPGERAKAELHVEFDGGIEDLRSTGTGACMRATVAALAEDPPEGPLSLHLGSDRAQAVDPSLVRPRLGADERDLFAQRVRALAGELRSVAEGCAEEPADVRMKIAVEGPRGTIVHATVDDPPGHPAEACLAEATLGRELGGLSDERPLHAIFPIHVGP